jgi:hypothetical protein
MYQLEEVFDEAVLDPYVAILDTNSVEARIIFGIKIVKVRQGNQVFILNTSKGGNYYEEITPKEYENFTEKGWRYGVYVVSLSNYRAKLESIDSKIHSLIVNKSSKSSIEDAQESRTKVMNRYSKITKKLNELNQTL